MCKINVLVNIGIFSGANEHIDAHDMFDYVHLTQEGYRKIFEPVLVAVSAALNPDQ